MSSPSSSDDDSFLFWNFFFTTFLSTWVDSVVVASVTTIPFSIIRSNAYRDKAVMKPVRLLKLQRIPYFSILLVTLLLSLGSIRSVFLLLLDAQLESQKPRNDVEDINILGLYPFCLSFSFLLFLLDSLLFLLKMTTNTRQQAVLYLWHSKCYSENTQAKHTSIGSR